MNGRRRSELFLGILLLFFGTWFLAKQLIPGFAAWASDLVDWPLLIILIGGLFLLSGIVFHLPDLAIPACIIGGVGGLLYYQNATGDWDSWAYAWTLIPGFVGCGIITAGLIGFKKRPAQKYLVDGGRLLVISGVMFVIFAAFLGGKTWISPYWPVLFILAGLWMLVKPLIKKRSQ